MAVITEQGALGEESHVTENTTARVSVSALPGGASRAFACPACGGDNEAGAVFCANAACHKALGEFRYVREELLDAARWHELLAERIAGFIGKPHFVAVHVVVFGLWVAINTGIVVFVRAFDEYPFGLLGIILSVEAILITGFVLISQRRQNAHADTRAELDYEVNVRTYREIHEIKSMLEVTRARLDDVSAAVARFNRSCE